MNLIYEFFAVFLSLEIKLETGLYVFSFSNIFKRASAELGRWGDQYESEAYPDAPGPFCTEVHHYSQQRKNCPQFPRRRCTKFLWWWLILNKRSVELGAHIWPEEVWQVKILVH